MISAAMVSTSMALPQDPTVKNYGLWEQKGPHLIIDKWRQLSFTLGKRVKVYCQNKHIEGTAADIDKDGGLLIRKDSGILAKVMAGDVIHCR